VNSNHVASLSHSGTLPGTTLSYILIICTCTAAGHSELYLFVGPASPHGLNGLRTFVYQFTFKTSLLQLAYVL
jgi:hypothetical protein